MFWHFVLWSWLSCSDVDRSRQKFHRRSADSSLTIRVDDPLPNEWVFLGLDVMEFAPTLMSAKDGDVARSAMKLQPFIKSLQDSFTALEKVPTYSETSDKGPSERGQTSEQWTNQKYSSIHTLYKITSKRGQPLYKGQNPGSRMCPLFGGSTLHHDDNSPTVVTKICV